MATAQPHYKHLKEKSVSIVLAPFSGGQGKGGVENGPDYMLKHGLEKQLQELGWKTSIKEPLKDTNYEELKQTATEKSATSKTKRGDLVGEATKKIYNTCKNEIGDDFQLTIGGDHSIAMGSIAGLLQRYPDAGIIWIDAHADINTVTTTESGNLHGCPVSFLMGLDKENYPPELQWIPNQVLKTDKICYIGLRDVDAGEKKILQENNIKAFSMYHVDRFGINSVVEMAIDHVSKGNKDCPLMISYDVDALEPSYVKCTGTMVKNGLTLREGFFICERIAETGNLVALDVVEVNPELGTNDMDILDTIMAGCAVVRCTMGETLL
ncbi:hypothetical protein ACO0RG_002823 [Hanseniaspora osmophila]|uniref:Arginase n=1 Tax=Hanseniaspora osmophila TaxID=56408 RepID=A0A1E5R8M7_9ASCO|nr:Arginase [Hanseniaspora osmophila]